MHKHFNEYGLRYDICSSLSKSGINTPFEIQSLTIPLALEGRDIIGQAKTGEGKTLAFGLPILHKVFPEYWKKHPQALILEPTRELASQVNENLKNASVDRGDGLKIELIVGGTDFDKQISMLENKGADIISGTPGRILDLANRGILHLENIDYLVLDEADEMLDMGFIDDIRKIIEKTPSTRQTFLFSATMPSEIILIAHRYMNNPMRISTLSAQTHGAKVENIRNFAYRAHPLDKIEMLARILEIPDRQKTIVFTSTKHNATRICEDLKSRGFNVRELHGNLSQNRREHAIGRFSDTEDNSAVLITTDVAARGIDIDNISHVVNFECPKDKTSYLHRTGRTGRAGNSGTAITFIDWEDLVRWNQISDDIGLELTDPPETYSTSDIYRIQLNVPHDAKGYLGNNSPSERAKSMPKSVSKSSNKGSDNRKFGDKKQSKPKNARTNVKNERNRQNSTESDTKISQIDSVQRREKGSRRRIKRQS